MKLTAEIALEEQMHTAAEKMLNVAAENSKDSVIKQISVSGQRLQNMKWEIEKTMTLLQGSSNESPKSQSNDEKLIAIVESEINTTKGILDNLIKKEVSNKEHAEKMVIRREKTLSKTSPTQSSTSPTFPSEELTQYDRNIAKMKEDMSFLNGSDQIRIKQVLKKYSDVNGHQFKSRNYYVPTDCAVCHEPLWGSGNGQGQGIECGRCRVVTHKHCKNLIDISCEDYEYIQNIPAMYFMAPDYMDKQRWLVGLDFYRREVDRMQTTNRQNILISACTL
ncbi:hypothetical protein HK096_007411 [Nowakowskiella sp. JEL0078]|nr:hypothetical protein HK096_007411 [Nowakowskiella sp. JEL0078]